MDIYQEKKAAAENALKYVKSNMILGIGTGSTAEIFVTALGKKITDHGLNIIGVPTSDSIRDFCLKQGVPIAESVFSDKIDLCIDGADEFNSDFQLIKGGGGALLREKITAQAAKKMIVIADSTKKKQHLGAFPLPVEIFPHCVNSTLDKLTLIYHAYNTVSAEQNSLTVRKSSNGETFITDFGNYIVDIPLKKIIDPEKLAYKLHSIAGVAEHGLFLKEADCILSGSETYIKTSFY